MDKAWQEFRISLTNLKTLVTSYFLLQLAQCCLKCQAPISTLKEERRTILLSPLHARTQTLRSWSYGSFTSTTALVTETYRFLTMEKGKAQGRLQDTLHPEERWLMARYLSSSCSRVRQDVRGETKKGRSHTEGKAGDFE